MSRRVITRKPIALDTTLRSPRRIPRFISILKEFEGKVLVDKVALELEAEIIKQKIFVPGANTLGTYVKEYNGKFKFHAKDQSNEAPKKVEEIYSLWEKSSPGEFSRDKIIYLLENTITKRKDRGWKGGWESRIHTQFNFLNELGLVRVRKNEEIKISNNGHLMIKEYKNGHPRFDDYSTSYEESSFLNAFAKYQINNPYRSNIIKVNLFYLILGVMNELKRMGYDNGILIKELAFVISWGNNDYIKLAKMIDEFRKKYGYNASDEIIYSYAMNFMATEDFEKVYLKPATNKFIEEKKKHFKIEKLLHETPDELVRKLRLTKLITLRGAGRFIDINKFEKSKVEHILTNYQLNKNFSNEDEYFIYMGEIDPKLNFPNKEKETMEIIDVKNKKINEYSKLLKWDKIKKEMKICVSNKGSTDEVLKYIESPARFEFLVAIALKKALPEIELKANYIADDEGLPFTTASGRTKNSSGADIDIYEDNIHVLAEPTISSSEAFQVDHEIPSIRRHVFAAYDIDKKENVRVNDWFALFITGKVREDVGNQIKSVLETNKIEIYPWEIDDFIEYSIDVGSIEDYRIIREYAQPKILGG